MNTKYIIFAFHVDDFDLFHLYIEDIYFFEVNIKYISSSLLKTSENLDVVNTWDDRFDIY